MNTVAAFFVATLVIVASPAAALKNITCGACPANVCSAGLLCPNPKSSYVCLTGPLNGSCSSLPWEEPQCTSCCDESKCPAPNCADKCDSQTCENAQCVKTAPFVCTAGPAKGACATTQTFFETFPGDSKCRGCCNLNTCQNVTCGKCSPTQCAKRTCANPKYPFVCTKGKAVDACQAKPWTLGQGCEECCDESSCPMPDCKQACTKDQCASGLAMCNVHTDPFICTQGSLLNACAPQASYFETFPGNAGCLDCCDLAKC